MKVQINQEGTITKVLLDGKDVTFGLISVEAELKADCVPIVRLEIAPNELDISGDFEVLKKIKQEKNVVRTINMNTQGDLNGIIEHLVESISKTLKE